MKLSFMGHTLKKWNDTSHDCESDQLIPISCICTRVERVNRLSFDIYKPIDQGT